MAIFEKGILGGFSGKVGNVVGSRWRGKDVMRSLPQRGNYTPTAKQEEQRKKFKTVISFLTPILSVVNMYFGNKQGDKSRYNLAASYHLREAVIASGLGYAMDYTKVLISKGDLRGIDNGAMTAAAGQTLNFTWVDNSGQGNATAFDEFMVVAYAPDLNTFYTNLAVDTRDATAASVTLPPFMAGFEVEVWASFNKPGTHQAAISTYMGMATIL
ncbi:conserved hypothetical protein [Formosa agariphila KMM 3901]|uniref:Uncharacterized protein n=1 Tax=Formosa agariphila (strain DSM 15362 / KCTC 12365 / LMG 23005 / KMM 3901 / M-2Alg 35-1) TaxID=1347342 RepID=T2KPW4_FORAG|nr:DUF6266 family protein [Formosa agariphila]CDF80034.1 conserved hypothetical protein [Formosa agariphila KMM 3901]